MRRVLTAFLAASLVFVMAASAQADPAEPDDVATTQIAELLALQDAEGTGVALAELERRAQTIGRVSAVCHDVAHELGHAALDRVAGNLSAALAFRTDVCGGGYVHGVVERLLASSKKPARDLAKVCDVTDGACWHGVGHGLMFATRMDVDRSLEFCAKAPSEVMERRCGEGVFMQLFNAESSEARNLPSAAQASRQCRQTPAPQTANCWFYAPNVLLSAKPDAFPAAMRWCASLPTETGRQVCARGVGSRTVKRHANDLQVGVRTCAHAGRLRQQCLGGMASYWSVHWQGRKTPASLCPELPALRRECRTAVRG